MFFHRFCGPWLRFVLLGLILCVSGLAGCSFGPKQGTVSGKITYKGEPLGNGTVVFIGADNNGGSSQIGPDGTYKISNMPVGAMKITVETKPVGPSTTGIPGIRESDLGKMPNVEPMRPTKNTPNRYVKIPDRYKLPSESGLTYEVVPGEQTHDIDLK